MRIKVTDGLEFFERIKISGSERRFGNGGGKCVEENSVGRELADADDAALSCEILSIRLNCSAGIADGNRWVAFDVFWILLCCQRAT